MDYIVDDKNSRRISELNSVYDIQYNDYFAVSRLSASSGLLEQIFEITKNDNKYKSFLRYLQSKKDAGFSSENVNMVIQGINAISKKIQYSDLSTQVAFETSSLLNLNTMAFRSKSEYAEIGHFHNYSNVKTKSLYDKNSGTSCLAIISVYNSRKLLQTTEIYMPEFIQPEYNQYEVGQMRLIGLNNLQQKKYDNPNFDGWVYMDGSRYPKNLFPAAYEIFKDLPNSDMSYFQVPNLNGFIIPENGSNSESAFMEVHWENRLPEHTHSNIDSTQLSNQQYKNIKFSPKFPYYNADYSNGGNKSFHTGYSGKYNSDLAYSVSFSFNIKTLSTETLTMSNTEIESWPEYINIPAMVYIGLPKK